MSNIQITYDVYGMIIKLSGNREFSNVFHMKILYASPSETEI